MKKQTWSEVFDIPASGLKIAGTDVTASAAELNKVSDISANGFTLIGKTKSEMKAYLEISQSNSCNTSQAVACNNATNGAPGLQGAQGPQRRAGVNGTNGVCTCHCASSASNNNSEHLGLIIGVFIMNLCTLAFLCLSKKNKKSLTSVAIDK